MTRFSLLFLFLFLFLSSSAQYDRAYFRHPLNIPMQLVANFGEIRTNHWHMGLDIRTQQKENLPVYAAAEGYVSRIVVEPGGFGQAIYIDHPNGLTTLYAHMNGFYPALASYVKSEQYRLQRWHVSLNLPPKLFTVKKGEFIGRSGNTGGSQGPHVHFEIRKTATDECLNPLYFNFPIADAVPPTLTRLAMYDRSLSTYMQSPQILALSGGGRRWTVPSLIRSGSDRISFAIGAVDRLSGSMNPNGIAGARMIVDGKEVSSFEHDEISYNDTRYINAQLDLPYKARATRDLQHITPLPGARTVPYKMANEDGILYLDEEKIHEVKIEIWDGRKNTTTIELRVQYDPNLRVGVRKAEGVEMFLPNQVNVFENSNFEIYTTEKTIYDIVPASYSSMGTGYSAIHQFLSPAIPVHDSVTVRIAGEDIDPAKRDRVVIRNKAGTRTYVRKARWNSGSFHTSFRQFGTYQLVVDEEPPVIPAIPQNLSKSSRIAVRPTDNLATIKSFRAEIDGQWLRFTNDKGKTWIYYFDEYFPRGNHELKITVEDEAGNVTERRFSVSR